MGNGKIKITKTERGFDYAAFKDLKGENCSIQKSSIANQDAIWLGINKLRPTILASDARKLGIQPYDNTDCGWIPFDVPKEVSLSARMHLSIGQVRKLIPILQKFVDTGEID